MCGSCFCSRPSCCCSLVFGIDDIVVCVAVVNVALGRSSFLFLFFTFLVSLL